MTVAAVGQNLSDACFAPTTTRVSRLATLLSFDNVTMRIAHLS